MKQDEVTSSAASHQGSHPEFYDYYATESLLPRTRDRFRRIRDTILRVTPIAESARVYSVADIGCGAGSQSILWAELGHRVHGLDVNAQLLDLARKRATGAGYNIEFVVGS